MGPLRREVSPMPFADIFTSVSPVEAPLLLGSDFLYPQGR